MLPVLPVWIMLAPRFWLWLRYRLAHRALDLCLQNSQQQCKKMTTKLIFNTVFKSQATLIRPRFVINWLIANSSQPRRRCFAGSAFSSPSSWRSWPRSCCRQRRRGPPAASGATGLPCHGPPDAICPPPLRCPTRQRLLP